MVIELLMLSDLELLLRSGQTHKDEVRRGRRFSDARGPDERPQHVAPNKKIATMVYIIAEMPS